MSRVAGRSPEHEDATLWLPFQIGTFLASLIVVFLSALLVATAGLRIAGRRRLACWLLMVVPAFLSGAALVDLTRGISALGAAAYQSDKKQLLFSVVFLFVTLPAVLFPRRQLFFWAPWMIGALVCGALVYLAFFWKVFS